MSPLFNFLNIFSMAFLSQAILAYPSPAPVFERQTAAVPDYVSTYGMLHGFGKVIMVTLIHHSSCCMALPWRELFSIGHWDSVGPYEARDQLYCHRRLRKPIDA